MQNWTEKLHLAYLLICYTLFFIVGLAVTYNTYWVYLFVVLYVIVIIDSIVSFSNSNKDKR